MPGTVRFNETFEQLKSGVGEPGTLGLGLVDIVASSVAQIIWRHIIR